ncbi:Aste57867_18016 [Aphanomyces stellatus]|uniref:Aste57867_18016 protein n=1 Tax=Aphanomyces stellatus TaxID=120398 RepID=A0A485L9V5_9STRA|nr:hypothetical protein As57867_017954 [Aphanomyces stellatus]VFT94755.1 Aste57867_18016 [Aphanomyces stellatus]
MKIQSIAFLGAIAAAYASEDTTSKRLILLSDDHAEWMTADEVAALSLREIGFVDNTDRSWDAIFQLGAARLTSRNAAKEFPEAVAFGDVVDAVKAKINPDELADSLTAFVSEYANRVYNSTDGQQSCGWIFDQVEALASATDRSDLQITVRKFDHTWGQYSVIARVEPTNSDSGRVLSDVVIASAHQDSINWKDWTNDNRDIAPGADDDGSGSITILQSLKYLLASDEWKPIRPIELHWYSAEEVGLLGSKAVAKAYAVANTDVYAQMQQDMTGYVRPGTEPVVSLMDDFTSAPLTSFLEKLVTAYLDIPFTHSKCGYGCSDHFSWNKTGYAGAMPFETNFKDLNRNIHSQNDTLETIDYDHMAEFTKLTVAYFVELTQDPASTRS